MSTCKPVIRIRKNPGGSTSFCVDAGNVNGKRYRKFCPTKAEAITHAKQLEAARRRQGALAFTLTAQQQVDALNAFKVLDGLSVTLTEAAASYRKRNCPKGGKKRANEVVAEFLEAKAKAGNKPRYIKELRCKYDRFKKTFGESFLNEISREQVQEWLDSQKTVNGEAEKPISLLTKTNYRRDLGILFHFAVKRGYCAESVIEAIEKPKVPETETEVFTPRESLRLLFAAHIRPKLELVPYLAIGLFAGLRAAELKKLDWKQIDLDGMTIQVTAENSKTGRSRIVEIPDNLFAWLEPYEKEEGPVTPKNFYRRKDEVVEMAEITKVVEMAEIAKWPKNGLRHSFGTYHYAFHEDSAKTAAQMGHENTKMLFQHYRGKPVTKAVAALFWKIMPPPEGLLIPMGAIPSIAQSKKPNPKAEELKKMFAAFVDGTGNLTGAEIQVKAEQAAA